MKMTVQIVKFCLLATLVALSACAPVQENNWSGNMSNGTVSIMGPSGPIGP